jgi:5-methylcytosine-specific restriction endonuclease McrA
MELVPVSPPLDFSVPACKHCKRAFTPRHDRGRPQLHCSDECRLAYRKASGAESLAGWKYRNSETGRESRRMQKRRKKVKVGGELRDHSFDRLQIFARDAWRCQLCGQTVQDADSTLMDSATIRLRVPIQLGGRYSFDNCETACRQCNGRAAALVAKSLNDPSFSLPRSLRF